MSAIARQMTAMSAVDRFACAFPVETWGLDVALTVFVGDPSMEERSACVAVLPVLVDELELPLGAVGVDERGELGEEADVFVSVALEDGPEFSFKHVSVAK